MRLGPVMGPGFSSVPVFAPVSASGYGVWCDPVWRPLSGAATSPETSASHDTIDEPEIIRAILAQRDVTCPRCRYNLRGLTAANCPECQEPIRLHVSGPRPHRPLVWLTRFVILACAIRALTAVISIAVVFHYWDLYAGASYGPGFLAVGPALTWLGCAWVLLTVVRWLRCRDLQLREAARWRVLCTGAALLAVLSLSDLALWVVQVVTVVTGEPAPKPGKEDQEDQGAHRRRMSFLIPFPLFKGSYPVPYSLSPASPAPA
jgi:hypothetical protein